MPSARKISVRTRLTIAFLLVITFSWTLSTGTVMYSVRLEANRIRQELRKSPHQIPQLIREMMEKPFLARRVLTIEQAGHTTVLLLPIPFGQGQFIARLAGTLLIVLIAGAVISRYISRPLARLEQGAKAYHDGNFSHRLPVEKDDEFARLAETMNAMATRIDGQLVDAREDARRRTQLLADVAHELRSPVATVMTMAEALRDGVADDPTRRERAISAMVEYAGRLQGLVTDLLDLSRLDLHELPLARQTVDLHALVISCVSAHHDAAAEAGMTLSGPKTGNPLPTEADPRRLIQVLENILGNAIAHAGAGAAITVAIHDADQQIITISDTGRGIPAEHMPFLFDPFYRVDDARTPADNHSGLGLRIARGLVEAHGGTLTLESRDGEGVTVTISLPAINKPTE